MNGRLPRSVRVLFALEFALFTITVVAILVAAPGSLAGAVPAQLMLFISAAICLARARAKPNERWAWRAFAAGMLLASAGNVVLTLEVGASGGEPVGTTSADWVWMIAYLMGGVGIMALIRARVERLRSVAWLDGVIAASGAGAVSAAIVLQALLAKGLPSATMELAVALWYPIVDIILLALIGTAVTFAGRVGGYTWALIAAAIAVNGAADVFYLFTFESFLPSGATDILWGASPVLISMAAWMPAERVRASQTGGLIDAPVVFGVIGAGMLAIDHFVELNLVAVGLGVVCVCAVLVRLRTTHHENINLLDAAEQRAATDALTGLANRRRLLADLEARLDPDSTAPESSLAMLDLNGFKHYNDTFGHPAGDLLLARIAGRLAGAVGDRGCAYRVGGDEFCLLVDGTGSDADAIVTAAAAAMAEHGDGFSIDCAHGIARLPGEAGDVAAALALVDQRMYANKESSRQSVSRHSGDVLLLALGVRDPSLDAHNGSVSRLARAVARALELDAAAIERVGLVADLHDVGKLAIPDAILLKQGALDDEEWDFVRRHTVIGERILERAPGLGAIAPLVRATHERFAGGGYPDGLVGPEIPVEARIVAVCDAFDAITSDRPYRAAHSAEWALAEIDACSGEQFDPAVVTALTAVVNEERRGHAA